MVASLRDTAADTASSGTITLTIPATVQAGDVLLAVVTYRSTADMPTPVGWTRLDPAAGVILDYGQSVAVYTYWRPAVASDAGATVTWTGAQAQRLAVVLAAYQGANGATPVRDHGLASAGSSSVTAVGCAAETTVAGDLVVLIGGGRTASNAPATWTAPAGYTVRRQISGSSAASQNVATVLADGTTFGAQNLGVDVGLWAGGGQIILAPTASGTSGTGGGVMALSATAPGGRIGGTGGAVITLGAMAGAATEDTGVPAAVQPPIAPVSFDVRVFAPDDLVIGALSQTMRLELLLKQNDVGTWLLEVPAGWQADLLVPGGGIIVYDRGSYITSGVMTAADKIIDESHPAGYWKISGVTDEALLASDRIAYPVPGQPHTNQSAAEKDVRTGTAEALMYAYVNANAGPDALGIRQVRGLTLGTSQGRGLNTTYSARDETLGEVLRALAAPSGLGWRVVRSSGGVRFEVYQPADRSATARFSFRLGNLRSVTQSVRAPSVTQAIVGGDGDGTARVYREVTGSDGGFGRRSEQFVDARHATNSTEMDSAGLDALALGGPSKGIALVPIETPQLRYGRDYGLGDLVTVDVDPAFTEVVREVHITWSQAGREVTTSVGDQAMKSARVPDLYRRMRAAEQAAATSARIA